MRGSGARCGCLLFVFVAACGDDAAGEMEAGPLPSSHHDAGASAATASGDDGPATQRSDGGVRPARDVDASAPEPQGPEPSGPPVEVRADQPRTLGFYDRPRVCQIDAVGDILCWHPDSPDPVTLQAGPFVGLALGGDRDDRHYCGLDPDGGITCWKSAVRDPTAPLCGTGVAMPCVNGGVPPEASYVGLSVGYLSGCGVTEAGAIECWGLDDELGVAQAPMGEDFVWVASSHAASCAIREGGALHCWGDLDFEQEPLAQPATQVEMVGSDRCVLLQDGSVECHGRDVPPDRAADPPLARISIAGGISWRRGACGLTAEGRAVCWGTDALERITPLPGPYREVANTTEDACGLRGDGVVECWGLDWGNGGGDERCLLHEAQLSTGGREHAFSLRQWGGWGGTFGPGWHFLTSLTVGEYPDDNDLPFVLIAGAGLARTGAPHEVFAEDDAVELSRTVWALDATPESAGEILCSGPASGSTFTRNGDELVFDARLSSLGQCPGQAVEGELRWIDGQGLGGTLDGTPWPETGALSLGVEYVEFQDGSHLRLSLDADRTAMHWGLFATSASSPFAGQVFCIGDATRTGDNWSFRDISTLGSCPDDGAQSLTGCIR